MSSVIPLPMSWYPLEQHHHIPPWFYELEYDVIPDPMSLSLQVCPLPRRHDDEDGMKTSWYKP